MFTGTTEVALTSGQENLTLEDIRSSKPRLDQHSTNETKKSTGSDYSLSTLSLREASIMTGIPHRTLYRACVDPNFNIRLECLRFSSRGRIRILKSDLIDFINRLRRWEEGE